MQVSEEMRERFRQEMEKYGRYSREKMQLAQDLIQRERPRLAEGERKLRTDNRVVNCFAGYYDPDSPDKEEARQRIAEWILDYESGSASRRRPYLDRFMEEIDQVHFDLDGDLEEKIREFIWAEGIQYKLQTDRICYTQNLEADNPEYFAERYNTPVKKHLLYSEQEMSAAVNGFALVIYAEEGYAYNTGKPVEAAYAETIRGNKDEILMKTAVQYHLYQTSLAVAREEHPADRVAFRIPGNFKAAGLSADQLREGGNVSRRAEVQAQELYKSLIGGQLYDTRNEQKKLLDNAGLSEYDMIMINGRSASELFGSRCRDAGNGTYDAQMKRYIIGALTSGRDRVEVATLHYAPDSSLKVQVSALHPDLTAIQPDKKQEYGWFRRTFFDWGPFRCKTRQEKLDDLWNKDSRKERRAEEIGNRVLPRVKEGIRRGIYEKAAEAIRPHSDPEREFYGSIKSQDEMSQYFNQLGEANGLPSLGRIASRVSLGRLFLLSQGISLEEILSDNPEALERKRQAGIQLDEMLRTGDRDRLARMCREAGEALLNESVPEMPDLSPNSIINGYKKATCLSQLVIDYSQIFRISSGVWEPEQEKEWYQNTMLKLGLMGEYCASIKELTREYSIMDPDNQDISKYQKTGNALAHKALLERYYSQFNGRKAEDLTADEVELHRAKGRTLDATGKLDNFGEGQRYQEILCGIGELPQNVRQEMGLLRNEQNAQNEIEAERTNFNQLTGANRTNARQGQAHPVRQSETMVREHSSGTLQSGRGRS